MRLEIKTAPADGVPPILRRLMERSTRPPAPVFRAFAQTMRGEVKKTFDQEGQITKWQKSRGAEARSGKTLSATGMLQRSISYQPGPNFLRVGTSDKRARLLFLGGEVRPKNAKALTIPVDPRNKKRARDYDDLYVIPDHQIGDDFLGVLARNTGKKQKPKAMFFLLKRVIITPHPFIEYTPHARNVLLANLLNFYSGRPLK